MIHFLFFAFGPLSQARVTSGIFFPPSLTRGGPPPSQARGKKDSGSYPSLTQRPKRKKQKMNHF